MKKTAIFIGVIVLLASTVFADDVSIDQNGNVTTGISNTNANLEVTGANEDGIVSRTSGDGKAGVYGGHTQSGNFGILGDDQYGVYGESATGEAGHFQGNAKVTGDLTVDGVLTAPNILDKPTYDTDEDGKVNSAVTADTATDSDTVDGKHSADLLDKATYDTNFDGKVNSAGIADTAINADMVDSKHASDFATSIHGHGSLYSKVVVVAQSGGDYTSPLAAMKNVDDGDNWCGIPGPANPCLIRIMPGVYDIGNEPLLMRSYVDIEGSGENTTIITSTNSTPVSNGNSATVTGADNAEIRFLTVENRGGSSASFAIYNNNSSPKITNVTAIASGGLNSIAVYNIYSSPTLLNVQSTGTGTGTGSGIGVYNEFSSSILNSVTATGEGGTNSNYGVYNVSSPVNLVNVTATASGGTFSHGVKNLTSVALKLTNLTATASGGTNNYGVNNDTSSPVMTNVTATGTGGTLRYGVYNYASSPVMKQTTSNGIVINGNILFLPDLGSDSENGLALLSVSDQLSGLGTPSAVNRYTVRLDAATYDLGPNAFVMKPYVDIEGSGENVSIITSTRSSTLAEDSATVVGDNNAEIRFLTIENDGGSTNSIALYNGSVSPKITNVTASASGGTNNYGVFNLSSSSPAMTNVTATASGGTSNIGIFNWGSSPTMTNVTATASGGTDSYGVSNALYSLPVMTAVVAKASGANNNNYGVSNSANSFPSMKEVSSNGIVINGNQLFVPATSSANDNGFVLQTVFNEIAGLGTPSSQNRYVVKLDAGTYGLVNNALYMQSYVDIEGSGKDSTIVTSTHSSASGDENSATVVGATNAEIRSLTIENLGGSNISIGVYNSSASPKLTHVAVKASGGSEHAWGVLNNNSSAPTLYDVTVSASAAPTSYGVYTLNSSIGPTILNSRISGLSRPIYNLTGATVFVANTALNGIPDGGITRCIGAYTYNYVALDYFCSIPGP